MGDIWQCAWRELLRRKRRTLGNVGGYCLAVLTLVVLVALLGFARDSANTILRHTGTHFVAFNTCCAEPCYLNGIPEKGETFIGNGGVLTAALTMDYLDQVRKIPSIKHAAPYILFRFKDPGNGTFFSVGGFSPWDTASVGTTCCAETDLLRGRFLKPEDKGWVMVEEAFAKNRNLRPGDALVIAGVTYRVCGIVNPGIRPGKADVYMLFQEASEAIRRRLPAVTGFNLVLVEVRSSTEQDEAISAVRKILPTGVVSSYACYKPAASVLGMNERAAWLLSWVIGLFALLFLMRSQMASVTERRYEIGVLKAIGWSNRQVMAQILSESVLQAMAGGLVGCGVGAVLLLSCPVARWTGIAATAPVGISPWLMGIGMLVSIVGGAVAGLLPAFSAARQSPANTLRQL